jgi:hypothetical protein
MRQMPKRFSQRWWRLWYSGAIPREPVYLDYLASELEKYQKRFPRDYEKIFGDISFCDIRQGRSLACAPNIPRPLLDLGARCKQDLGLPEKVYEEAFCKLIGSTAAESDLRFR